MRPGLPLVVAIVTLIAVALPGLWQPLNGDTALFHVGAQHLLDGAILYSDFWDLKAPGVYAIHLLAVALFSVDAHGLHLLALIGHIWAVVLVARSLRGHLSPWLAALAGAPG